MAPLLESAYCFKAEDDIARLIQWNDRYGQVPIYSNVVWV
jgi:hypothetical protein